MSRNSNHEMITRKHQPPKSNANWPYTPDPSPPLKPTGARTADSLNMSEEDLTRARPISMMRKQGILSPNSRPTLEEVLNEQAPHPYTLSAYTAFLSQQHCLETLEFTIEARKYRSKYDAAAAQMAGMPLTTDSDEGFELMMDWTRILDVYVKPGAPREINLPSEERDDMVDYPYDPKPPPPEALDASVKRMYDLMAGSIFIPFCNSLRVPTQAQTYSTLSELAERDSRLDSSRLTFVDRGTMNQRTSAPRMKSPPKSTTSFNLPSRSPPSRHSHSSTLTSALGGAGGAGSSRLSTHASHSSAASVGESAISDDSMESPGPSDRDTLSPPTTPPTSDLGHAGSHGQGHSLLSKSLQQRSDSGSWKKMGVKIWGKKKNGGSVRERPEAP